jgi:hypothetical protein
MIISPEDNPHPDRKIQNLFIVPEGEELFMQYPQLGVIIDSVIKTYGDNDQLPFFPFPKKFAEGIRIGHMARGSQSIIERMEIKTADSKKGEDIQQYVIKIHRGQKRHLEQSYVEEARQVEELRKEFGSYLDQLKVAMPITVYANERYSITKFVGCTPYNMIKFCRILD